MDLSKLTRGDQVIGHQRDRFFIFSFFNGSGWRRDERGDRPSFERASERMAGSELVHVSIAILIGIAMAGYVILEGRRT